MSTFSQVVDGLINRVSNVDFGELLSLGAAYAIDRSGSGFFNASAPRSVIKAESLATRLNVLRCRGLSTQIGVPEAAGSGISPTLGSLRKVQKAVCPQGKSRLKDSLRSIQPTRCGRRAPRYPNALNHNRRTARLSYLVHPHGL
jgi:hypothetical protein